MRPKIQGGHVLRTPLFVPGADGCGHYSHMILLWKFRHDGEIRMVQIGRER